MIEVEVPVFLFMSVSTFVLVVVAVPFCSFAKVCSAGHSIYTDCVFDSILNDVDDFRSDSYNLIRSQSRREAFRVALGG